MVTAWGVPVCALRVPRGVARSERTRLQRSSHRDIAPEGLHWNIDSFLQTLGAVSVQEEENKTMQFAAPRSSTHGDDYTYIYTA